ncbi:MAG: pyruvoyl-dependent arginine decarboxylase, partial [Segetibacter sp.]
LTNIIIHGKIKIMDILIKKGIGEGPTTLSAFDAALHKAGIANYNLIRLSSVIPPKSTIKIKSTSKYTEGEWGDRLYVVMAEKRVDTPNTEAWAGIGWVQDKTTQKGLFVEHEGESKTAVCRDIEQSLRALMQTRNAKFGPIEMQVKGVICKSKPVCALVAAVYKTASW